MSKRSIEVQAAVEAMTQQIIVNNAGSMLASGVGSVAVVDRCMKVAEEYQDGLSKRIEEGLVSEEAIDALFI